MAVGQAEDSVAISLGYGRRAAGLVAGSAKWSVDAAGFDAYALRGTDGMGIGTGHGRQGRRRLHVRHDQEHHLIDEIGMKGRRERLHKLVMEGTEEQWKEDEELHRARLPRAQARERSSTRRKYEGTHQWGMTIDLSTCNGCNACVIACQSENNIPIVGKEQVSAAVRCTGCGSTSTTRATPRTPRPWTRSTSRSTACSARTRPASRSARWRRRVHGEEGTNDMVYNRCIGTRYCGNNCPVKVRRFNYFHYTKYMDKPAPHAKR